MLFLAFFLWSKTDEFGTDKALSGKASPFINYTQGRDNKVEHYALFFSSTTAQQKGSWLCLNGKAAGKQTAAINGGLSCYHIEKLYTQFQLLKQF